jgi:hypothetical protein
MNKIFIILILFIELFSIENHNSTIPFIWTDKEKPSLENNFDDNKYIFKSNDLGTALSVTAIEILLNKEKLINKNKKLNTNFKYLKKFEDNNSK